MVGGGRQEEETLPEETYTTSDVEEGGLVTPGSLPRLCELEGGRRPAVREETGWCELRQEEMTKEREEKEELY